MSFDPEEFMNASVDEANDTHYVPIPEGDYNAVIADITPPATTDKGNVFVHCIWELDAPLIAKQLERDRLVVRQTVWLDLNDEGKLDTGKGKNVPLGRIREAVGLNGAGFRFSALRGCVAHIKVSQRLDKESGEIFNDVKAVTKLA